MNSINDIPNLQSTQTQSQVNSPLPTPSSQVKKIKISLIPLVLVLFLGVGSGIIAKQYIGPSSGGSIINGNNIKTDTTGGIKVGDIFGSKDEKSFKDSAKGVLDKGGLNGEGTHKLLRSGGESQTVYLTSSVVDLDEFVGSEITVWGDTFSGRKVGWLMDVGRVKVEALNATAPTE